MIIGVESGVHRIEGRQLVSDRRTCLPRVVMRIRFAACHAKAS